MAKAYSAKPFVFQTFPSPVMTSVVRNCCLWTAPKAVKHAFKQTSFSLKLARRDLQMRCLSGNGATEGDYDYDLFTIGAGSGGVRAARQSASRGV